MHAGLSVRSNKNFAQSLRRLKSCSCLICQLIVESGMSVKHNDRKSIFCKSEDSYQATQALIIVYFDHGSINQNKNSYAGDSTSGLERRDLVESDLTSAI